MNAVTNGYKKTILKRGGAEIAEKGKRAWQFSNGWKPSLRYKRKDFLGKSITATTHFSF